MRTNMVAPLPPNHFTHQASNALVKIARQPLGYLSISCLFPDQIRLKAAAENRIHAVFPKTWLKVRPESFPDTRSSSRRLRSALIASSVRESPSRLCTNNFARSARSAGASESASSATARFVIAIGLNYLPQEAAQGKLPGCSPPALTGGEGDEAPTDADRQREGPAPEPRRAWAGLILHRHHEVLHDVVFALRRVLAHVEGEDAGGVVFRGVFHLA